MKSMTIEHIIMVCIFSLFIRDMVIEFKPEKDKETNNVKNKDKSGTLHVNNQVVSDTNQIKGGIE